MNTPQLPKYKILLIGDDCEDVYQYGTVDRLSPEAPVPVFKITRIEKKPGMAGNVKKNLENLGCIVEYLCGETSTKTRLIDEKSMQHIVRIDDDVESETVDYSFLNLNEYDAIVISDYNKGSVDYETITMLRKDFAGPIFIDTKKRDLKQFEGCIVKINNTEFKNAKSYCKELIVTQGESGVLYKGDKFPADSVNVADVCGAGDTFLAALTFQFLETRMMHSAIIFAMAAAEITVQHVGVYAPTLEEICG